VCSGNRGVPEELPCQKIAFENLWHEPKHLRVRSSHPTLLIVKQPRLNVEVRDDADSCLPIITFSHCFACLRMKAVSRALSHSGTTANVYSPVVCPQQRRWQHGHVPVCEQRQGTNRGVFVDSRSLFPSVITVPRPC
jgi:hypothetical protein